MALLTHLVVAIGVFLLFCLTPAVAQFGQSIIDGVAAVVNDKVITFSEVKKQVDPAERELRELYSGQDLVDRVKQARLSALKSLVERELIIQDFHKRQFFIPDSLIEDRLREIIQTQFDGDRTAFIRTILANGLSLDQYKEELRNNTIVGAMRARNVSNAVIISPFKIERYYQENLREFIQPPQMRLSIIYLRKGLFKETRKNAQGEEERYDPAQVVAEEILFKLNTGADFAEMARTYSEGRNRENGGDWGWIKKGDLREDIVQVASSLRPGQMSPIVTTDDGYYIIRLEDLREERLQAMSEVRDSIEATLIRLDRQRLQQEWLDSLRSKAYIKMF